MVNAFFAVVYDLFLFLRGHDTLHLVSDTPIIVPKQLLQRTPVVALPPASVPTLIPAVVETNVSTQPTLPLIPATPSFPLHEPIVMYVQNLAGGVGYVTPAVAFDTIQNTYPFGTAVTVSEFNGNYAHVLRGTVKNWMKKDDLTPHKSDVWPTLTEWVLYGAQAPDTIKIRSLISDSFSGGTVQLPLQAGEYILFRLLFDNRIISWPDDRPRLPGYWQSILKGVQGIHASIMPKTDSVMEWQSESDGGRLAYVESVAPDNTITTTCVGLIMAGQYTKQVWTQEQWRELRPVFIEVD